MSEKPFLTDARSLRQRARQHIDEGAATTGNPADRETVLKLLNDTLATEMVCVLRCRRYHFVAKVHHPVAGADRFVAHTLDEQGHADQIAERIVQLGGAPDFSPDGLVTCRSREYGEGKPLVELIKEDIVAECIVMDTYRDVIGYLGNRDPATRHMIEGILAAEKKHAEEMADLLECLPA